MCHQIWAKVTQYNPEKGCWLARGTKGERILLFRSHRAFVTYNDTKTEVKYHLDTGGVLRDPVIGDFIVALLEARPELVAKSAKGRKGTRITIQPKMWAYQANHQRKVNYTLRVLAEMNRSDQGVLEQPDESQILQAD